MVVAKNAAALESLAKQFKDRTVRKKYLALVYGELKKDAGNHLLCRHKEEKVLFLF